MHERILVADDEPDIADLVCLYLQNENYETRVCYSGQEALEEVRREKPDLAILDIMMPGVSGLTVCREIRKKDTYPVIFLTAKGEEIDKINGLALGADDYITKPFRPLEMVARVKAQLRRSKKYNCTGQEEDLLVRGGLTLNVRTHQCTLGGKDLKLTPTEFSVLEILCRKKGSVVSSEELFHAIWKDEYYSRKNNTITVHIRHLREKMGDSIDHPRYIKTVWGAVIKLKSSKKYWKAAAGVLVSLLVLYFLFDFVDYVCNGVFVEWFTRNFVTSVPSWYDPQTGTTVMREEIFWPSLKNFIFWGMAVVAAAVIILVFAFYREKYGEDTAGGPGEHGQHEGRAEEAGPGH